MIREGNTRQIRMQITRSTTVVAAFLHPSRRHPVFHTSEDVVPEPSISLLGSLLCYRATKRQSRCNPDGRGELKHENKIHVRPQVNIHSPHRLDFEFLLAGVRATAKERRDARTHTLPTQTSERSTMPTR